MEQPPLAPLTVFWGDVQREGPEGLDFSSCQFKYIPSERMDNFSLSDLRRAIRHEFDRETVVKKLVIEVVTCRDDFQPILHKIRSDADVRAYIRYTRTPGTPFFGRPMVYVQWFDTPRSLGYQARRSTDVQGGSEAVPMEIVELGNEVVVQGSDVVALNNEARVEDNAVYDRYFSARIDSHEVLQLAPDQVESDGGNNSPDEAEEGEDRGPARVVATMAAMDALTVQALARDDGHMTNYGYDADTLLLGQEYPNKKSVVQAITRYFLQLNKEFKVKKSNPSLYKVICAKYEEVGCHGRIRAQGSSDGMFRITVLTEHTCELNEPIGLHRNVKVAYLAELLTSSVSTDVSVSAKSLMDEVVNQVGFAVSKHKVRRAKYRVIENMYGTYEAAYNLAPRLLVQIQEANHGIYLARQDRPHPTLPYTLILDRLFWAFGQTIEAFRHCRPVLAMDGTFLNGKYKGTLLTAIAGDVNDQLLPIAFALVESEIKESWHWFLCNVKSCVVRDRPDVCLITDRNAGLLGAINALKNAGPDNPYRWPDVRPRWCVRHLAANLYTKIPSKKLMDKFKRMCMQNQKKKKYDALWNELEAMSEVLIQQLGDSDDNPPPAPPPPVPYGTSKFAKWIRDRASEIEKWSLCHDTDGARYGVMTTNMSEIYNGVLRGVRWLPLTAIVAETWTRTCSYFVNRVQNAHDRIDKGKQWSIVVQNHKDRKMRRGQQHHVMVLDGHRRKYEICLRQKHLNNHTVGERKQVVTLEGDTCKCTCNKPLLLHYPCSHVYAACATVNQNTSGYISPYFTMEKVVATWSAEWFSYGLDMHYRDMWPNCQPWVPDDSLRRVKKGRRQTRRFRNDMDASQRGQSKKCSRCKNPGHTIRTCTNEPVSSVRTND